MKPTVPTRKTVAQTVDPPAPDTAPARLRLPLATIADCRREIARVYRSAKARTLDVGDASKLVNILFILARLIESSDLEQRIARLEVAHGND
jgi:hypothetical protein